MPTDPDKEPNVSRAVPSTRGGTAAGEGDVDLSLLADSLAMTPWERMQVNDDILNFGDSLRSAMEKRNAKSQ
jgi:hypothetical protein